MADITTIPPVKRMDFQASYKSGDLIQSLGLIHDMLQANPEAPLNYIQLYLLLMDNLDSIHDTICRLDARFLTAVDDLKSLTMLLGPYRNLTTLTGSILHLHPACQTLNHAGERIFHNPRLNFLLQYDDIRFAEFVKYCLLASVCGEKGNFGGSILHSHAFEHQKMKTAFDSLYEEQMIKPAIQVLVWKESHRLLNQIHQYQVNLEDLIRQNPKIRFLMPVRNVLDCAISNCFNKVPYYKNFELCHAITTENRLQDVIVGILKELKWFVEQQKTSAYPDHFYYFFETDLKHQPRETLSQIAQFAQLEPSAEWLNVAEQSFDLKQSYDIEPDVLAFYTEQVQDLFQDIPDVKEKLLVYAQIHKASGQ